MLILFLSSQGFIKSGGFNGIYRGFNAAVVGSIPGASLFFVGYESSRSYLSSYGLVGEIVASSIGEISACLARCPTELIKQRAQISNTAPYEIFRSVIRSEGIAGLYRGYSTLVVREIPFSVIQMPLWQFLKKKLDAENNAFLGGLAGAIAGATAAAITTPIDVAKTRIMTSKDKHNLKMLDVMKQVYGHDGVKGLFAGILPRVFWITIGGFIFLGSYDKMMNTLKKVKVD